MAWTPSSNHHELLIPDHATWTHKRRGSFSSFAMQLCRGEHREPRRQNRRPICYWRDYRTYKRAPFPMCFTQDALERLLWTVGKRFPESGAKGFGPKDHLGFDVIEFDRRGSNLAGGVMYAPDVDWGESRRVHHLSQPGDRMRLWTGDAHSHPGHMGTPSRRSGPGLGDLGYAQLVFEENEWMEWFLIPILTGVCTDEVTLHPWVVHRSEPDVPMIADGALVCEPDEFPERTFNPVWLARQDEPVEEEPEQVEVLEAPQPRDEPSPAIRTHTRFMPSEERRAFELEYTRRLEGVVSREFRKARILVVGLGAGSHMVEKLARLAPAELTLCDLDVVEIPNLARTVYTAEDARLRRSKVAAMTARLHDINPMLKVRTCDRDITKLSPDQLDQLFGGVDLVIAGTDQFRAQATVNAEAVDRGIPAVFIGIHRDGFGGRVVGFLPGETGCYCCAARERYELHEQGGQGSLDLHGAVGSIIDSQFVDMVASKLVMGILERGRPGHAGGFLRGVNGRTDVIVRCDPRYQHGRDLWDFALSDLEGDQSAELHQHVLFAMDTAWLENLPQPDCPVCGEAARAVMEDLEVTEEVPRVEPLWYPVLEVLAREVPQDFPVSEPRRAEPIAPSAPVTVTVESSEPDPDDEVASEEHGA